jgi:hypothetical protein
MIGKLFTKEHRDDFLREIERILPDGDFFYLAGPMSDYEKLNFPEFDRVAFNLRAEDYTIASPAEFDHEEVRAQILAAEGVPIHDEIAGGLWEDCLARDIVIVCHPRCQGIVLLEGWHRSRGALFETDVADRLSKPLREYNDDPHDRLGPPIDRNTRIQELNDVDYAIKQIAEHKEVEDALR